MISFIFIIIGIICLKLGSTSGRFFFIGGDYSIIWITVICLYKIKNEFIINIWKQKLHFNLFDITPINELGLWLSKLLKESNIYIYDHVSVMIDLFFFYNVHFLWETNEQKMKWKFQRWFILSAIEKIIKKIYLIKMSIFNEIYEYFPFQLSQLINQGNFTLNFNNTNLSKPTHVQFNKQIIISAFQYTQIH